MKSFGLILLTEEISKQLSIESVVWLLMLTLMKIYSEKEQTEQGKYLRRKGAPESRKEQSPVFKEINRF